MLSATIHPDIKLTLIAISDRTGMSVSQVTDEVLYTGLVEMQELPEHEELLQKTGLYRQLVSKQLSGSGLKDFKKN